MSRSSRADKAVARSISGWYVDPGAHNTLRFFDGDEWTDRVAPAPDYAVVTALGWLSVFLMPPAAVAIGLLLGDKSRASAWIALLGIIGSIAVLLVIVSLISASDTSTYYPTTP